ncbi:MAG: hypothetical protein GY934_20675 [Gammaproteobacteria bacterium]|nr:hypothetical protein [Gammaproteobacteria bacterium]
MKNLVFIFAVLMAFISVPSFAAGVTAQVTWDAPVLRADGSALLAEQIEGYRIYMAVDSDVTSDVDSEHVFVSTGTTEPMRIDLMPRPEPYTVNVGIRTETTDGLISALSDVASMTVVVESTAVPNAPTDVQLQINCTMGCVITNAP